MKFLPQLRKVAPNGLSARLFLAFLSTAGLFYVNIMPAIVSGLIEALGFTNQQAGSVASANMYGAAFGALAIVPFVRRMPWQWVALGFLLILITVDLLSIAVSHPTTMVAVRFVHGFVGGMLVGTGFSVMARTEQPDRSFGMLLVVQYGLGGLGVMFIPALVPLFGTAVLFLALVAFSSVTLVMLAFLPDYRIDERESLARAQAHAGVRALPLVLTIVSLFLFQAANMGLYAYIIGLGEHYGLQLPFISGTLGVAAWLGLAGAALVVIMADRLGYLNSLAGGIAFTVIGTWALFYSDLPWVWVVSNCLIGITWAYTVAYLFGLMSRYDTTGQMAALGGFASKMGLASGPVAAAALLGQNDYDRVIWVAVFALIVSLLAIVYPALLLRRVPAS